MAMTFMLVTLFLILLPYHAECVVNSSTTSTTTPNTTANTTTRLHGNETTITTTPFVNTTTHDHETEHCTGFTAWQNDVYMNSLNCKTNTCIAYFVPIYDHYLHCNDHKARDETQKIASQLSEVLLNRAVQITGTSDLPGLQQRTVERITAEHLSAEFGTLKRNMYLPEDLIIIDFKEYGIPDELIFPPTILEEDRISFQVSIYVKIYKPDVNYEYWKEVTPLRRALSKLPPSLTNPAPNKDIGYQINSNILYFNLNPAKKILHEYILIKFYYRDPKGTTNHRCVRFTTFWTDAGCYEHQKEETYVLCRCETFSGRYAMISDLAIPPSTPAKLKRTSKSLALIGISGLGIISALASILLPYILKCSHLKGMLRIYKAADLTFIVFCAFVLLSVFQSENMGTSKLIAAVVHYLHHASAVWYIVEGVHLYHEMTPLYSDSIGMIFCYSTVAFGISAALAGASTGYDFAFTGRTEFLWAYASGGGILYLLIPTFGIIIMQLTFSVLLVWELMSWIGSKYDYLYTRSVIFIRRCLGYVCVYAITHVLGMVAMVNNGSNTYDWFFIGFFGIETICLLYHHCIGNMECWSWKEIQDFKKEMEKNEELKRALGGVMTMELSDDSSSDDSEGEDGNKCTESIATTARSKQGDLVINMDEGTVFYGNPTRTSSQPSTKHSSRLTNRKSTDNATSSELRLIRESDTSSLSSASDKSLRKTPPPPTLYPRLDERLSGSRVSVATTMSNKSLREHDEAVADVQNKVENTYEGSDPATATQNDENDDSPDPQNEIQEHAQSSNEQNEKIEPENNAETEEGNGENQMQTESDKIIENELIPEFPRNRSLNELELRTEATIDINSMENAESKENAHTSKEGLEESA